MFNNDRRQPALSTCVTAVGVDHVQLSYHYLDTGDIDAYGSLLDEHAQVRRPDAPPSHGREEILSLQVELAARSRGHHIHKIVAEYDTVAVMGWLTASPDSGLAQDARQVEFADFFTITDKGMLLGYRRFYFVPPA